MMFGSYLPRILELTHISAKKYRHYLDPREYETDDLVQLSLIRLSRMWPRYQPKKHTMEGWVNRAVQRQAMDMARMRQRHMRRNYKGAKPEQLVNVEVLTEVLEKVKPSVVHESMPPIPRIQGGGWRRWDTWQIVLVRMIRDRTQASVRGIHAMIQAEPMIRDLLGIHAVPSVATVHRVVRTGSRLGPIPMRR